ncbi:SHOCT domain-containing protein [Dactylosporangium vinaceum]|uniref:SHOCT domain-containing protein n=1 Tax=Dactylosporangium vinaceum TaxID=53362 RepID=A0ABV5MK95_9ACTN|nr:SHOCT domain-containing protein [Dactylosporangium vinaceum]UAB99628.1 SHOCT domain-containing protein [Dactylosporangium vinaceum]
MKISVREVLSLMIGLGGVALLASGIYHLLDVGTCGTGGPHVIARECPQGSGIWGVLLPIGLFLWFIGLFVSKQGLVKPGAGQIVWSALFAGGGFALLYLVLTQPDLGPGAELAAYIMAAVFLPLGVGIWIPSLLKLRRKPPGGPEAQTTEATVAGDRTAWMQQLHRLLGDEALTRAEFDRLARDPAGSGGRVALIQQLADLRASGLLSAEEFTAKKHTVLLGDSGRAAG